MVCGKEASAGEIIATSVNQIVPLKFLRGTVLHWGALKFTTLTSGAHDVIAITSSQKNDLCTEELRDRAKSWGQSTT